MVRNWEKHALQPEVRFYPTIISFLGYDPQPTPKTLGESIRRARWGRGWSLERLASVSGVDPATAARIEAEVPRLGTRTTRLIRQALDLCSDE